MNLPKKAWLPGAKWVAKDNSNLIAIIVGPSKFHEKMTKEVWMYEEGGFRGNKAVQNSYSHKHMLKYFNYSGETATIDPTKELI